MEPVKLASGIGGAHGPQLLYPRQPPPGHPVHPSTTRPHEGSPYKETISPPMVSRGDRFPQYDHPTDGPPRYVHQLPVYHHNYQRDSYARSMSDRPVMLPHHQPSRRPSMMGSYGGYSSRDIIPQMMGASTLPVNTTLDISRKRMKLQPVKTDVRFPLVVDTDTNHSSRESPYYPKVEAISPTLPTDARDGGSPLESTKDDLIQQIEQVDKEITLAESSIANLQKKEKDLHQAAAQKADTSSKPEAEECKEVKHQSTAQIIYAENRKKAEEGHNSLIKLIIPSEAPTVLPLYHQPSDTEVYRENKAKYLLFKVLLLDFFKRKQETKGIRDQDLTQTYSKLMIDWVRKVDKAENSKKQKEKVAKSRELFEKVFPELRKQREDKERLSRVGARVKSDAEMEEIIDGIQDQENEDKKMRAYAVIPPILLDEKSRRYRYLNKNGLIEDAFSDYKEYKSVNVWTEQEEELFKDKFCLHPKNFIVISSYLERKSVSDCINFYYRTKKNNNYKNLVKRRMRRPRNKGGITSSNSASAGSAGCLLTGNLIDAAGGVTTRGSAAAAQKELMKSGPDTPGQEDVTLNGGGMSSNSNNCTSIMSSSSSTFVNTTSTTSYPNDIEMTPVNPCNTSSTSSSLGTTDSTCTTMASDLSKKSDISNNQEVREKDKENLSMHSDKLLRKVKRDEDKMDSSDEESISEHGHTTGAYNCAVCQTRLEHLGQSRPIAPHKASHYGLSETSIGLHARVCDNCKNRRRRIPQCPLPTCTTAKWRVKRLRPFPSTWNTLPQSVKDPIINELKIPSDVTKSCSSCLNRIVTKLGSDAEEPLDTSGWSQIDIETLREALREVGCHWTKVTEKVQTKTQGQCKSFYFNLKGKYKLDEAVSEYRKAKGKSSLGSGGPPCVTDEEESGSTTSSCDEMGTLPPPQHHPPPPHQVRHDSASDTASASSPINNNIDAHPDRKDAGNRDSIIKEPHPPTAHMNADYDSSATASADELIPGGREQVGRESPPEVQHIPHPGEKKGKHSLPPPVPSSRSIAPPAAAIGATAPPSGPMFKQLIEKTVEDSIAKMNPNKGFHDNAGQMVNETMTVSSLLEMPGFSAKNTASTPPSRPSQQQPPPLPPSTTSIGSWGGYVQPQAPPQQKNPHSYSECESGLDLTVKKRERSPQPLGVHSSPHHPPSMPSMPPTMTVRGGAEVIVTGGKGSPPRAHSNSISYSQTTEHRYIQDYRKPPTVSVYQPELRTPTSAGAISSMVSRIPSPHMVYSTPQGAVRVPGPFPKSKQPSMAPPVNSSTPRASHFSTLSQSTSSGRLPLKTEKIPMTMHGSITHGTPVNQHSLAANAALSQVSRYEMIKPVREGGSITQGTPVHHDPKRSSGSMSKEAIMYESRTGTSAVEIIPRSAPPGGYEREPSAAIYSNRASLLPSSRPSVTSIPTTYPYTTTFTAHSSNIPQRQSPYSDSLLSSRQIETDYITSIQMTGGSRRPPPLIDKDNRVPQNRSREPPQTSSRDHRERLHPRFEGRIMGPREAPSREPRPEHSIEYAPIIRTLAPQDNDKFRKVQQYVKTNHGYLPLHSQAYLPTTELRVSRPPASPASVRDATPTPPSTESLSPHDFRSPGVSTPTPPPRAGVIQRRPPSNKPSHHLPPPKSASPRPETERFSPHSRHHPLGIPSNLVPEGLNIEMIHRGAYNPRIHHPPHHSSEGAQQLEGIGKQFVESYIADSQEKEMVDNRPGVSDDRNRYHDPNLDEDIDMQRLEYENRRERERELVYRTAVAHGPPQQHKLTAKEHQQHMEDATEGKKMILTNYLDTNKAATSKRNNSNADGLTAANLIEAIITNQISSQGGNHEDGRDNRGRSPAYHQKEKEIVTVEDGNDSSSSNIPHQQHRGHPHMSPVINRSLEQHQQSNKLSLSSGGHSSHLYLRPPPLEITTPDGRAVTHLNLYDQGAKVRSSPSGTGHMPTDERQIIRIAQPPQNRSTDAFDYIKNKIKEIWKEDASSLPPSEVGDKRTYDAAALGPPRSSRSGTPVMHHRQPPLTISSASMNRNYEEEHAKKRPRLDLDNRVGPPRPPSRPKSNTSLDNNNKEGVMHPPREDVADSPQSGEMVIDETPQHQSVLKMNDPNDKNRGSYPSSNAYPPYRSGGNNSWGSSGRTQGYEPNCEPVSDEETNPKNN